ncbi:hypothetical protein CLOM_g17750 [Closterium sp. NIES-68]|nr:hypothetical protein CLOM_g17750 [Closterium sp. NIES-68]GJP62044.1 hypothetical protein CLOP_g19148 [Closterium sp. NIES-67]
MPAINYDDPEIQPPQQSRSSTHVRASRIAEDLAGNAGTCGEEQPLAGREGGGKVGETAEWAETGKLGERAERGGMGEQVERVAGGNSAGSPIVRGARRERGTGGGRKRRKRIAVARTALGCAFGLLALLGVALMGRSRGGGGSSASWRAAEPLLIHPPLEPSPLLPGLASFAPEIDMVKVERVRRENTYVPPVVQRVFIDISGATMTFKDNVQAPNPIHALPPEEQQLLLRLAELAEGDEGDGERGDGGDGERGDGGDGERGDGEGKGEEGEGDRGEEGGERGEREVVVDREKGGKAEEEEEGKGKEVGRIEERDDAKGKGEKGNGEEGKEGEERGET